MLVHKEFVEKIYQYQNLVNEMEEVEREIETFILKDSTLNSAEQSNVWKEIRIILKNSAISNDPELAIAQLDLMIAQIKVKKLTERAVATKPKNVLLFDELSNAE
ncbi:lipase chaperone [Bacillus massiliigorillae]|uniref:lipase chaperone n=1 Tax=Bacillus massiliigorillae TaxID=1243664 RepID=UPI00039A614C|nr:lipase chaperone [Bacillus massiliigorillae]